MDKLKFALLSVVTLSILGLLGYWSVVTLQSGAEYKTDKKVEQLQKENEDLKDQVKKLGEELGVLNSKLALLAPVVEKPSESKSDVVSYKYQMLIDELQKLVDKKVYFKLGSRSPSVGTVQKFLNIFNDTSNKIDNDYGANMKTAVSAFQKDQGLTVDGQVGPGTISKMIEWLKKQG